MATYYVDAAVGNDGNLGTSPGAGNAWATIGKGMATAVAGDTVNVKASASYVITSSLTPTNAGNASGNITFQGYTSSPGDGGQATITTATNSVPLITSGGKNGISLLNFNLTTTAAVKSDGIQCTTSDTKGWLFSNITLNGFVWGVNADNGSFFTFAGSTFVGCSFLNCTTGGATLASNFTEAITVRDCLFTGNLDGLRINNVMSPIIQRCVFYNNTRYGVSWIASGTAYINLSSCVLANNTSDGLHLADFSAQSPQPNIVLEDCIIWGNGGWGVNVSVNSPLTVAVNRNNAYGSNTSGNRNNLAAGTNDVALTASPFTNPGGNDFSLNATAGGGPLCKSAGWPGAALYGTGKEDIGPVRHADPVSGAPLSRAFLGMGCGP